MIIFIILIKLVLNSFSDVHDVFLFLFLKTLLLAWLPGLV